MTTAQKIIKYLAISFAIFLILAIISAIMGGLYGFGHLLGIRKADDKVSSAEMKIRTFENTDINELSLDVAYADLEVKTGEVLNVETNIDKIEFNESNNQLQIKETKHNNWFMRNNQRKLILSIPTNMQFKKIKISTGAGRVSIGNLTAENLYIELGAGEATINNINVAETCDIDSGAGKLTLNASNINNLNFDMGIGEANIEAKLTGKNDIDAGVGSLNIKLFGKKEDYKIQVDKGMGNINIDGNNISKDQIYGNGESFVDIDGGIGNIKVDFVSENI